MDLLCLATRPVLTVCNLISSNSGFRSRELNYWNDRPSQYLKNIRAEPETAQLYDANYEAPATHDTEIDSHEFSLGKIKL